MKRFVFSFILIWTAAISICQPHRVTIDKSSDGLKLMVNEKAFIINGMNWDYYPVGTNYTYHIWDQPDEVIKEGIDQEMTLLKNMGVNSIRVYTGIPKYWIQYIYENYGIYTMLNHTFGRYGLNLDDTWVGNTDYSERRTKELLLREVKELVSEYKDTPGLLLYLLGNENNYGLFWEGAETEDIPVADRKSTVKAWPLYKLMNEAAVEMKKIDASHPVALCNGDIFFLDIISKECKDIDIFGTNVYRGVSLGDAFDRVKNEYGKPILFTEFGADAFNMITKEEDQKSQAFYLYHHWKEIYENTAAMGKAGNSIGGYTFQFSDGWWKYKQTKNLEIHDSTATWTNGGYHFDYNPGEQNMNEEWFGICAKGPTDAKGNYTLYPRAAYYMLKKVHDFDPYSKKASLASLKAHFDKIKLKGIQSETSGEGNKIKIKKD